MPQRAAGTKGRRQQLRTHACTHARVERAGVGACFQQRARDGLVAHQARPMQRRIAALICCCHVLHVGGRQGEEAAVGADRGQLSTDGSTHSFLCKALLHGSPLFTQPAGLQSVRVVCHRAHPAGTLCSPRHTSKLPHRACIQQHFDNLCMPVCRRHVQRCGRDGEVSNSWDTRALCEHIRQVICHIPTTAPAALPRNPSARRTATSSPALPCHLITPACKARCWQTLAHTPGKLHSASAGEPPASLTRLAPFVLRVHVHLAFQRALHVVAVAVARTVDEELYQLLLAGHAAD